MVCWSVTLVSPAKTSKVIEMPFGLRTQVGQGTMYYIWVLIPPIGRDNFEGGRSSHGHSAVTCAKTAEPIVMPLRLWTQTGPRNCVLDGVQIPRENGQFWGKGRPL